MVSLFAAAKISYTFALIPLGTIVLANAHAMAAAGTPARWLVRFALGIGAFTLLASAAVVVDSDWVGPGEPVVAVAATIYDPARGATPE